jgi:hypothetical protein
MEKLKLNPIASCIRRRMNIKAELSSNGHIPE